MSILLPFIGCAWCLGVKWRELKTCPSKGWEMYSVNKGWSLRVFFWKQGCSSSQSVCYLCPRERTLYFQQGGILLRSQQWCTAREEELEAFSRLIGVIGNPKKKWFCKIQLHLNSSDSRDLNIRFWGDEGLMGMRFMSDWTLLEITKVYPLSVQQYKHWYLFDKSIRLIKNCQS